MVRSSFKRMSDFWSPSQNFDFTIWKLCLVTVRLKKKCFIIQYTNYTGICLQFFADKQTSFWEKNVVLFTHKTRTETEPKPLPKNQGTDSTVGYLYRCTPSLQQVWLLSYLLQEIDHSNYVKCVSLLSVCVCEQRE